jgi:hypothetical protein
MDNTRVFRKTPISLLMARGDRRNATAQAVLIALDPGVMQ